MLDKVNIFKDEDGFAYKHPERSCDNCINYPCLSDMSGLKCDFAKYGCQNYTGFESLLKND